jgi:vitamin B12 transporter
MTRASRAASACAVAAFSLLASQSLNAQSPPATPPDVSASGVSAPGGNASPRGPLQFTVTAARSPQAIQRTGSAITVLSGADIRQANPGSLVDALRFVPGLDISESGGPGSISSVRIRGASTGQTLVLVDGIRVNDPSGPSADFDFSTLAPGLIERIEVLRGPQSALYGSDAIGGVVNIITRRGSGPVQTYSQIEGGSYGSLSASAGAHGSNGPWSYAFAGSGARSAGFSRFGFRIGRIEQRFPNLEPDGFSRFGGYGRIGYDPGKGFRFEAGVLSIRTNAQYDSAFGAFPDTPNLSTRDFHQVYGKASLDTLDGRLTHALTVFANRTDRRFDDVSFRTNTSLANTSRSLSDFSGERVGVEYQGDLSLDRFGKLSFGAKLERESADTFGRSVLPAPGARRRTLAAEQVTRSGFVLWQWPIGERFDISLSGRIDDVQDVATFNTWRATAAYRITETGTKLRASAGTGGKAPTLFQLFAPTFGNAALSAERSLGVDAGIDQELLDGRVRFSATAFANRFRNLIDFDSPTSRFVNVARASTSGIELAGDVVLIAQAVRLKGVYTYLQAKDRLTNLTLARRPQHIGKLSLVLNPTPSWTIEPSVTLVSGRFSGNQETARLAPYARLDVHTDYRIDGNWRVYGRAENLTNARYQEVQNFGTTGRAFYAGLSSTW